MRYYWILLSLFMLFACTGKATDKSLLPDYSTEKMAFDIDTLATGLENPWSMAFLPDGRVLIAERPGRLRIWQDGVLLVDPVIGLPEIWAQGQGGLLDVVMHPEYEENGWLYLAHAARGNGGGSTAISRGKLQGNQLAQVETIFHGQPHTNAGHHFGTRIVFDNEGYLFATIGDRGEMATAQDLSSHNGTVFRLYDDGRVPEDNPFVGQAGVLPEIWSYGHRNIQGMQLHPVTGKLWSHEHGARGGDEINIVRPGENYGWPLVTHGINYNGTIITPDTTRAGMADPLFHWTPSIAPCGMSFVFSDKYPGWEGNMLVGALAGQHIHRVEFDGERVVHTEKILEGMARFRDIRQGPDGYIYVLTENPGLFFRILPVGD